MASQAQTAKFQGFQEHHLRDQSLKVLKQAIEVAELPFSDLGDTWGVTVCVDPKTIFRLNVGNVSQLSVYRGFNEKRDPTGKVFYLYLAVVDRELGVLGEPRGLRWDKGFVQHVDDSAQLSGPFDKWGTKIFERKGIARAFRSHAQAAVRRLPNANWHNPLIDDLLR